MAKRPKDTREGDRHTGAAKTIRFTEDEMALLEAAKEKAGGTYAETIAAAARVYLGKNDLSNAELVRMIEARLK